MRKIALLFLVTLTILPKMQITAQDDGSPLLEVITPDNIGHMREIQRLGRGGLGTSTLSPNGNLLAVNTLYGIWLHDLTKPDSPPRLLKDSNGRGREINFTSDGNYIVSCCRNHGLWSTESSEQLFDYQDILGIRITPFDSIRIEERNQDASYHIWDWETQKTIFSLPYSVNAQSQLDPTGQYVVRFDEILETKMEIWHVDTNQIIAYFNPGTQIQWIEGGEHILFTDPVSGKSYVSALDNMSVAFEWDTYASYNQLWSYDGIIYAVDRISGKFVVVDGNTWQVWEGATPDYSSIYQSYIIAHEREIIAWYFLSDQVIRVFDLQQRALIRQYNYRRGSRYGPDLQYAARTLVATNSDSGYVDVYIDGNEHSHYEFHYHSQIETIMFTPNSEQLVSGTGSHIDPVIASWDNSVAFWDIQTGELIKDLNVHSNRIMSLDFSADGNYLISTAARDEVHVIGLREGVNGMKLPNTSFGAVFSPNNRIIAVSPDGNPQLVYHNLDISEVSTVPTGLVSRRIVFSNSGTMLANGNRIINLADGTIFLELDYRIRFLAFSPNDEYLAVSSGQEFEVWKVEEKRPIMGIRVHSASIVWGFNPVYVSFSSSGDVLAAAGGGNLVVLDTRDLSIIYQAQPGARNLALSPDGRYLAVGLWDGTISIYGVSAD